MEKLSTSVCHGALYVDDLQGRHVLHRQFHSSDRNRQDHWGFVPSVSSVYLLFTSSSSCWGWMLHKTGGLFSVKWNIYIQKHISTPIADVTEMTQKIADRLKSPAFYWCLWSRDHVLILFCISTQQCHKDSIGLISSFISSFYNFVFVCAAGVFTAPETTSTCTSLFPSCYEQSASSWRTKLCIPGRDCRTLTLLCSPT